MLNFIHLLAPAFRRVYRATAGYQLNNMLLGTARRTAWRSIFRPLGFYYFMRTQAIVAFIGLVVISIGSLFYLGILETFSTPNHWSMSYVTEFLSYVSLFILGWSSLVYINHWSDFAQMFISSSTAGFVHTLSNVIAYLYVVNVNLWTDFVYTLLTDPVNLWHTRAIMEIQLFYCLISQALFDGFTSLVGYIPNPVNNLFPGLGIFLRDTFILVADKVTGWIRWVCSGMWTYLVGRIYTGIAPQMVPGVIQPIVTPFFHGLASAISGFVVLFIIKILLGFW